LVLFAVYLTTTSASQDCIVSSNRKLTAKDAEGSGYALISNSEHRRVTEQSLIWLNVAGNTSLFTDHSISGFLRGDDSYWSLLDCDIM
jgi:hypothetical protein